MRAAVLVALAGCFSPDPPANQACSDWCPPPESCIAKTCQVDLGELAPNYAFVSTVSFPLTNAAGLDQTCAKLAADNKLPGTFFAWVSTSMANMRQRFAGNPARGWIRPDGKPFADRLDEIFAGKIYFPLRVAADGTDVGDATVATATSTDGQAAETCNDLEPMDTLFITFGKADAGAESWTALGTVRCTDQLSIYCFGNDRANAVSVAPPATGDKRAFVTKNAYSLRIPADADAICNMEAGGGAKFAALVATGTKSVHDRFASSTGPWLRADGVAVTEDMRSFAAPLELAFDGTRVRGEVWFGARSLTEKGALVQTCDDWMNPGAMGRVGHSDRSAGAAPFDTAQANCGEQYHYYCAEL